MHAMDLSEKVNLPDILAKNIQGTLKSAIPAFDQSRL